MRAFADTTAVHSKLNTEIGGARAMSSDDRTVALIKLKFGDLHTGVAMGAALFDACVDDGWVNPSSLGGFRFGHTSAKLPPAGVPVFCPPDIQPWDYETGVGPDTGS